MVGVAFLVNTRLIIEALAVHGSNLTRQLNACRFEKITFKLRIDLRHANYMQLIQNKQEPAQYIHLHTRTKERKPPASRHSDYNRKDCSHSHPRRTVQFCIWLLDHTLTTSSSSLRSNRSRGPSRRRRTTSVHGRGQKQRHVGHAQRHGGHSDLQVGWGGGGGGLRGRLAQPALDGEDDGCPADHFVAGEDLVFEVS